MVSLTSSTSRQPPHCAEMRSNSACTQRRAAPMPRVFDFVSDRVCRVPNATSVRTSASMRAADGARPMSYSSGCEDGGAASDDADDAARTGADIRAALAPSRKPVARTLRIDASIWSEGNLQPANEGRACGYPASLTIEVDLRRQTDHGLSQRCTRPILHAVGRYSPMRS